MKKWINDYLERNTKTILKNLKKDNFEQEIIKDLITYEKTTKNRQDILQYLYSQCKTNTGGVRMVNWIRLKPNFKNKGITLPQRLGRITLMRGKSVQVSDDALKFLNESYKDAFETAKEPKKEEKPKKEKEK